MYNNETITFTQRSAEFGRFEMGRSIPLPFKSKSAFALPGLGNGY